MVKEEFSEQQLYGFLPTKTDGIDTLIELALDLRWSWNHAADELWKQLDTELWERTRNAWIVLQTVSKDQLDKLLVDKKFRDKMDEMMQLRASKATESRWFQQQHSNSPLTCVAYFSMEFMLSEALPIYVGGLGNVAGDQLKSANDLGVPVVAVGLLYQQGYFRQEIDKYGTQQAIFPYNDPGQLPIRPLRLPNGEWLRIQISMSGIPIWLRTWQVQVGKLTLYLLDSNDAVNLPMHRGITSELYGGESEMRIKQEIILGIGGYKLLQALGIKPQVCHMNEGHAAFLILERANQFMQENNVSFEVALAITKAGNLFTTHTAVAAGFDHFIPDLMWRFLGDYAQDELKISFGELMALGRQDANNTSESFNMAFLAIRGSCAVNGVSRLHGRVSKHLFQPLFPRWPKDEVPVGYITNGVHMPSWDAEAADNIWTTSCGKDRWKGDLNKLEEHIDQLPDETLWELRTSCRKSFVDYTRKRLEQQFTVAGQTKEIIDITKKVFNPNTLTLGFARRFVAYKRPNLLLHDKERFIRILTNLERPVQLVVAGKAPPFDEQGKGLIREWMQFIQEHNLYEHVVFLSDHDMLLAGHMVQGADVWINTPRRPWEACGTSGMKVLVNGGINLSELDGWWAEAYTPEIGWALGDEKEHGDDPGWDAIEANALYDILEKQVVPEFYERNEKGIPARWIERMRKSMATLTPQFSANRTVREYTETYYLPAAENYLKRAAQKGIAGTKLVNIKTELNNNWNNIQLGELKIENVDNSFKFNILIHLSGIKPEHVQVQLFAEGINNAPAEIITMQMHKIGKDSVANNYYATISAKRAASDYSVRAIPNYEGVIVPLENNLIMWQH